MDRCEVVGGSFFDAVPSADAYIAKNIIHDWDDEHAQTILKNMRTCMQGKGKVLLVELVVTPNDKDATAVLIDLEMLHATHGGGNGRRLNSHNYLRPAACNSIALCGPSSRSRSWRLCPLLKGRSEGRRGKVIISSQTTVPVGPAPRPPVIRSFFRVSGKTVEIIEDRSGSVVFRDGSNSSMRVAVQWQA